MKLQKKILGIILTAVITACTFSPVVFADEHSISTYPIQIQVNEEILNTEKTPYSDLIPLRLVFEADHGNAYWIEQDNTANFSTLEDRVVVDLNTNQIKLNNEDITNQVKAEEIDGVTFADAKLFSLLKSYETEYDIEKKELYITTNNNSPLSKLAYKIIDESGINGVMRASKQEISNVGNLTTENYEEILCFNPLMIRADTLYVAKAKDTALAEKEFQSRLNAVIKSFEQYLPGPYELAKKGVVVVDGDYVMLIIAENNEKGINLFNQMVETLTK